ncbi:hypothetical protein BH23BAC1_BH23BAC1_23360 [soil metagenome]
MIKLLSTLFLVVIFFTSYTCYGQFGFSRNTTNSLQKYKFQIDQNILLGALPMQFNSSFTGEADVPRLNTALFYQNPHRGSPQLKLFTSFDQFIPAIGSGIGFTGGYGEPTGDHILASSLFFNFGIAPKFSLGGKLTISPSLNLNYNQSSRQIQIPQFMCVDATGNQVVCASNTRGLSSNAGLLINTNKYYIGYSINLFSKIKFESNLGIYGSEYPLLFNSGFQSSLQLGYTFESAGSKFSFTPQLVIGIGERNVPNSEELLYNYRDSPRYLPLSPVGPDKFVLSFRYDRLLWGLSDVGPQVGWQNDRFRFIISNNLNFNTININPFSFISGTRRNYTEGNISNFAFRYIFSKHEKVRSRWL